MPRDRISASPVGTILVPPTYRRLIRYRMLADGLCFQNMNTLRMETEKDLLYHDQLHAKQITCVVVCKDGEFIATGKLSYPASSPVSSLLI
jgi:hypothetical protein